MLRALWVAILMLALGGEVAAQSETGTPDTRCWHGSQSYSTGSLVRVGGKFYACGEANHWAEATAGGANCVYEDRNFSSGALVAVGQSLIACQPSGAWETMAAE